MAFAVTVSSLVCSFAGKHPSVTLSGLSTGDMLINKEHVCAVYVSIEKELIFKQLCNNLGFGNVIHAWTRSIAYKTNGWYFSCIGHETFLWQCYSWKGTCDYTTSMACQSKYTAPIKYIRL